MERDQDQRRLRTSLLISLAIWAVFMPLLSFLKFAGPPPPIDSMNPVFIELAPPETPPRAVPKPQSVAAPSDADRAGAEPVAAAASGGGSGRTAAGSSASREEAAPAPALRADPSASPIPASKTRSTAPFQGGSDPFAPLSEDSLRGDEAPSPVPTPAPAARTATAKAKTTSRSADAFDESLRDTSERLASGGGGGSAAGAGGTAAGKKAGTGTTSGSSTGSGAGRGPGSGDLSGGLDFGGGATRELWSPRKIRIPDRMLTDQPQDLVFTVSFIVEKGGTVLPSTIRFDPPVARADLDKHLRTAFSSWIFSPVDSDGQVVFRYSIKVQ